MNEILLKPLVQEANSIQELASMFVTNVGFGIYIQPIFYYGDTNVILMVEAVCPTDCSMPITNKAAIEFILKLSVLDYDEIFKVANLEGHRGVYFKTCSNYLQKLATLKSNIHNQKELQESVSDQFDSDMGDFRRGNQNYKLLIGKLLQLNEELDKEVEEVKIKYNTEITRVRNVIDNLEDGYATTVKQALDIDGIIEKKNDLYEEAEWLRDEAKNIKYLDQNYEEPF